MTRSRTRSVRARLLNGTLCIHIFRYRRTKVGRRVSRLTINLLYENVRQLVTDIYIISLVVAFKTDRGRLIDENCHENCVHTSRPVYKQPFEV